MVGGVCFIRKHLVKQRHHGKNRSSKPWTKEEIDDFVLQVDEDIKFAKNKGLLSDEYARAMQNKKEQIADFLRFESKPLI
ncbi:MAG: hypothetical protein K5978_00700 [Campylobacter sp.]|nr:hypothetical protein [Campylobacter sp.]